MDTSAEKFLKTLSWYGLTRLITDLKHKRRLLDSDEYMRVKLDLYRSDSQRLRYYGMRRAVRLLLTVPEPELHAAILRMKLSDNSDLYEINSVARLAAQGRDVLAPFERI